MKIKKFFALIKDHAPDLKMGIGTAGVVGGTAVLCKEVIRANQIIKEYREARKESEEAEANDIRKLQLQTAGKVALCCLPGAALEGAGLLSMWSGYSDVKAAFIGLGAVCTGLQDFIAKYREGVREKYGEEADEQLAYNFKTEEVVTKDENGEDKVETVRIYPNDYRNMPSPYARYFCYGETDGAEKSLDYNLRFLELQEEAFNRYFKARKKLMLNDVYHWLGYKPSKAGNRVGWVYDPDSPEGDNEIKLRIQLVYREKLDDLGNPDGWEKVIMIDPNVDGMVEDKMIRMGLMDE